MEVTQTTIEGTEAPAPIKPPRQRNRSGGSTRTRTRKPPAAKAEATTAKVQAPKKPAATVTAAQAKAGRATLAKTITTGVVHGCAGLGLITEMPELWELAPVEVVAVEQLASDAVAMMSGTAVNPESWAGRLLALSERYAAPVALVVGFGKILGPRAFLTVQAHRNAELMAMMRPDADTPETRAGAAWGAPTAPAGPMAPEPDITNWLHTARRDDLAGVG